MAANPKETTAIIRENAADHALRPLFMRFEWTLCIIASSSGDIKLIFQTVFFLALKVIFKVYKKKVVNLP